MLYGAFVSAEKSPHSAGMSPLARLLTRKQSDGLGFREMERKALAKGFRYSSSAFEQVAKDRRAGRLDIEAIRAIAAGVGEPVELIARLDDERWGLRHTYTPAEDEDALRYQRPPGLTDEAWERLKQDTRAFLEFQINRAAEER